MRADPRVLRSKAAILDACAELIEQEGMGGVTIEAVAARSGAAKTTIYRHWPTREGLLIDAFGICSQAAMPSPDSGSLRDDLVIVLGGLAERLNHGGFCSAMSSLIDAAAREPELERLHRETIADRRRPLTDLLERAVARGELAADLDMETAVALLAGPLFYRALIARTPLEAAFVGRTIDAALAELAPPGR